MKLRLWDEGFLSLVKACVMWRRNPKAERTNIDAVAKGASAWYDDEGERRNRLKGEKTT
jgi:hypothetical protein